MSTFDMKISVIVAVYNGAKTLQRYLDNIASQTYSNIELIVVDGESMDGMVDIIKNNEDKIIPAFKSQVQLLY